MIAMLGDSSNVCLVRNKTLNTERRLSLAVSVELRNRHHDDMLHENNSGEQKVHIVIEQKT